MGVMVKEELCWKVVEVAKECDGVMVVMLIFEMYVLRQNC